MYLNTYSDLHVILEVATVCHFNNNNNKCFFFQVLINLTRPQFPHDPWYQFACNNFGSFQNASFHQDE